MCKIKIFAKASKIVVPFNLNVAEFLIKNRLLSELDKIIEGTTTVFLKII